jgi:hypothetical protein
LGKAKTQPGYHNESKVPKREVVQAFLKNKSSIERTVPEKPLADRAPFGPFP